MVLDAPAATDRRRTAAGGGGGLGAGLREMWLSRPAAARIKVTRGRTLQAVKPLTLAASIWALARPRRLQICLILRRQLRSRPAMPSGKTRCACMERQPGAAQLR